MEWIENFKNKILTTDLSEVTKYKNEFIPSSLFHYRSFYDYTLKSLENDTVWAGSPLKLNDPYDCHIFVNEDAVRFKKIFSIISNLSSLPNPVDVPRIMKRIENGENITEVVVSLFGPLAVANDKFKKEVDLFLQHEFSSAADGVKELCISLKSIFGISSFSERVDSILMWAHYADNHKGFCIEYDFTISDIKNYLFPVIYQENIFDFSCVFNQEARVQALIISLIKAIDWSYEREWRIVVPREQPVEDGILVNVPKAKSVYMGSHIEDENEKIIIDLCRRKDINLFKMQHSFSKYKMIAKPVIIEK